ncbi:MAG: polyprenyl diphosphate synthase [archaeon]
MSMPKHIAIILDGNRRFSKKLRARPWKGHEWGAKKVEMLFSWCEEYGITELTLYTFSLENFQRSRTEVSYLMNLFRKEFDRLKDDERIARNRIRINFAGRLHLFPEDIQERMNGLMESTGKHSRYIVNFAMGYGGRAEIVDAARKIAEQVKSGRLKIEGINEETFSRNLYLSGEPDMIIRTGGEVRTSNFLNYQGAYSEWVFLEKTWPEFEKKDLADCIAEYAKRERRFGK